MAKRYLNSAFEVKVDADAFLNLIEDNISNHVAVLQRQPQPQQQHQPTQRIDQPVGETEYGSLLHGSPDQRASLAELLEAANGDGNSLRQREEIDADAAFVESFVHARAMHSANDSVFSVMTGETVRSKVTEHKANANAYKSLMPPPNDKTKSPVDQHVATPVDGDNPQGGDGIDEIVKSEQVGG